MKKINLLNERCYLQMIYTIRGLIKNTKELLQYIIKEQKPQLKMGRGCEQTFSRRYIDSYQELEKVLNTTNHQKEMQIKTHTEIPPLTYQPYFQKDNKQQVLVKV